MLLPPRLPTSAHGVEEGEEGPETPSAVRALAFVTLGNLNLNLNLPFPGEYPATFVHRITYHQSPIALLQQSLGAMQRLDAAPVLTVAVLL